ncbi:CD209 antigen-like protein C [Coregonus clupeaformis]|uniref:CD209 antigen-like protein C n=1 Tax=Coregonus clupeaformis TaxID=59861 RepID=UPI001E1C92BF|nr:CD209 antigen-like protein C [Coregonus clupeaformis]
MSEGVYENSDGFEDDEPDAMKNTDIDGQLYANVKDFKPSPRDGVVASVFPFTDGVIGHHDSTERDQLQTSYNNLTKERDQLQTSYNNLTKERDQLQNRIMFYEKPCLAGWWKFGTSCYYLSSTMNTAGGGQKECRTMGGELVVITSREEQIFINGFKKNVGIDAFKKDGTWQWVDNTSFATTYWMEGEPNNLNNKVACVEISQTATDPLKS